MKNNLKFKKVLLIILLIIIIMGLNIKKVMAFDLLGTNANEDNIVYRNLPGNSDREIMLGAWSLFGGTYPQGSGPMYNMNLFCAQYGTEPNLQKLTYTLKKDPYPVKSAYLNYIFSYKVPNHDTQFDVGKKGAASTAQSIKQNLIWEYIQRNPNDTDSIHMKNGGTWSTYPNKDLQIYKDFLSTDNVQNALKKYKLAAEGYVTKGNVRIEIKNMALSNDGKHVTFNVSGTFDWYELQYWDYNKNQYVSCKEGDYNYNKYSGGTISIPVSTFVNANAHEAWVRVIAHQERYSTKLYNLVHKEAEKSQQLIYAEPKVEDTTDTKEAHIALNTDVSLEKFITKAVSADGQNVRINNETRRHKGTVGTGSPIANYKKNIANGHTSNNDTLKNASPVVIEAGDYVTYRIYVYNNKGVNAKDIKIVDTLPDNSKYVSCTAANSTYRGGKTLEVTIPSLAGNQSTYFDVTVQFNAFSDKKIWNVAKLTSTNPGNKTDYRTEDGDSVIMQKYEVSLEKFISKVDGKNLTGPNSGMVSDRQGHPVYLGGDSKKWANIHKHKYNNVVTAENGKTLTYTITAKNDGKTPIKISEIVDTLPNEVKYQSSKFVKGRGTVTQKGNVLTVRVLDPMLNAGDYIEIEVTVIVKEPTISLDIIENVAEITKLTNKNGIEMDANTADETPGNNKDLDYFQMPDIIISGMVWNDRPLDKEGDYNGLYDKDDENQMEGIPVYLYRDKKGIVASTTTGKDGRYTFEAKDLINVTANEKYIKGPKNTGNNRWAGNYYSYYVIFEYDGVKYTTTKDGKSCVAITDKLAYSIGGNYKRNSNAAEGKGPNIVKEKYNRAKFNARFNPTPNNNVTIEYNTRNEKDYIPQSLYKEGADNMKMQASTDLITLSKDKDLEEQLQYVNLGLRGRDVFDLELASNVDKIYVDINGQNNTYNHTNEAPIRREDIEGLEDMANVKNEKQQTYVDEKNQYKQDQNIRNTDKKALREIKVTYKISIINASQTEGRATKIINYYDDRYNFEGAYDSTGEEIKNVEAGEADSKYGFKSVIIETPQTSLKQEEKMEIYVEYSLGAAGLEQIKALKDDGRMPTYNMAEIYEYQTYATKTGLLTDNEATRGLIDKDSAPGSANKEQVRLTTTEGQNTPTTGGNPTTVEYYFSKKADTDNSVDLTKLKYEDDTYATPTLYFVSDNSKRTIKGNIFEDFTTVDPENKIKSGNGIKDGTEPGVYGATIELINSNDEIAQTVYANENGDFELSGFIPGKYTIRYRYGDRTQTVLLHQSEPGNPEKPINKQSYNGEDYRSTNNTGVNGGTKLNDTQDYWYVYNETEGVSTGTEDSGRRQFVRDKVTAYNEDEMTRLNNVRDMIGTYTAGNEGTLTAKYKYIDKSAQSAEERYKELDPAISVTGIDKLISDTNMFATTPNMIFEIEEMVKIEGKDVKQKDTFGEYVVENMNFGIAEVPVTTIDLQKTVQSIEILDSLRTNTLAKAYRDDEGDWKVDKGGKAAILPYQTIDISIEDKDLQGAYIQVNFKITSKIDMQKDFDETPTKKATIQGLVDFIDNNLEYNPNLECAPGKTNKDYWDIITRDDVLKSFNNGNTKPLKGTVDPSGNIKTIVKAKENGQKNPLLKSDEGTAYITLEKVLTSTDATSENLAQDIYTYINSVEITKLYYGEEGNENNEQWDRIRTPDRYIIVPGRSNDSATSERITIHPPTGASGTNIIYYVIAVVSLGILAVGTFGIKKFVLNSKK